MTVLTPRNQQGLAPYDVLGDLGLDADVFAEQPPKEGADGSFKRNKAVGSRRCRHLVQD